MKKQNHTHTHTHTGHVTNIANFENSRQQMATILKMFTSSDIYLSCCNKTASTNVRTVIYNITTTYNSDRTLREQQK